MEYKNGKAKPSHYLVQLVDLNNPGYQQQKWFPQQHELVCDSALAKPSVFFNTYHQTWALIEQGIMLMYCEDTTFSYHNEFSECMKVEGATLEDVFNYLFDVGYEKFLSEKGKKYLYEIFEKWDPKHFQFDEYFDDYLDNNGLEDIIGDKGIQNLNMDD